MSCCGASGLARTRCSATTTSATRATRSPRRAGSKTSRLHSCSVTTPSSSSCAAAACSWWASTPSRIARAARIPRGGPTPTRTSASCSATTRTSSTAFGRACTSSCSRAICTTARSRSRTDGGRYGSRTPTGATRRGLYSRGGSALHVSPGLGTTFVPFRFFARPEATELVLRGGRPSLLGRFWDRSLCGRLSPMRLAGLLIGPVVLALLIVMGAARLSSALSEPFSVPPTQASGLVWDGRVFTSRAAFAKWLEERGLSIREWERRHPASPWATAKPTQAASSSESARRRAPIRAGVGWFVLALSGAAALLVGLAGAAALRHRRTAAVPPRQGSTCLRDRSACSPTPTNGRSRDCATTFSRRRGPGGAKGGRGGTASGAHRGRGGAPGGRSGPASASRASGPRARQGFGTAVAQTAELSRGLRYAIATESFRVALFYVFAALCSAAIGLAVAIGV